MRWEEGHADIRRNAYMCTHAWRHCEQISLIARLFKEVVHVCAWSTDNERIASLVIAGGLDEIFVHPKWFCFLFTSCSFVDIFSIVCVCVCVCMCVRACLHACQCKTERIATDNGLPSWEVPCAVYVESEPFTSANGLLTATAKLRRPKLQLHYREKLRSLYHRESEWRARLDMFFSRVVFQCGMVCPDKHIGQAAASFGNIVSWRLSAVHLFPKLRPF